MQTISLHLAPSSIIIVAWMYSNSYIVRIISMTPARFKFIAGNRTIRFMHDQKAHSFVFFRIQWNIRLLFGITVLKSTDKHRIRGKDWFRMLFNAQLQSHDYNSKIQISTEVIKNLALRANEKDFPLPVWISMLNEAQKMELLSVEN